MNLSDYPAQSLSFSSVAASGDSPQNLGVALSSALEAWVADNLGRRILQLTPIAAAGGLVALIIHTAGPELSGELAEQVAAAVEDALEIAGPSRATADDGRN
jgi:hypothetical protein